MLLTWEQWRALAPDKTQQVLNHQWFIKGLGADNNIYAMEVDPSSGGIPFTFASDKNWGVVGANTLRVAAELGNQTGLADFGSGASSGQTLRVVLSSDSAITLGYDTNYGAVGATTLRTAAEIGNATGGADFGSGVVGAQTLRTTLVTDVNVPIRALTSADVVTADQGGTWDINDITGTVSLPMGASTAANQTTANTSLASIDTKTPALGQALMAASSPVVIASDQSAIPVTLSGGALDFGASSAAERVAALLGNASGIADFNLGANSAQTLRVVSNTAFAGTAADLGSGTGGSATQRVVLDTRSEAAATPISVRLSSGSAFLGDDFGASSGAQRVASLIGNATGAADFNTGAAGAQTLRVVAASDSPKPANGSYVTSSLTEFATTTLSTSTWTTLVASTSADINNITIFMSSGSVLEIGTGAASSETRVLLVPPGAFDSVVPLHIPSGTRISVRVVTMTGSNPVPSSGILSINYLG